MPARRIILGVILTSTDGEFDVFPAAEVVAAPVTASNQFTKSNGQVTGYVFMQPAPPSIQCLLPSHRITPVTATFANVKLSHRMRRRSRSRGCSTCRLLEVHLEAGQSLRVLAGFTVPVTLTN